MAPTINLKGQLEIAQIKLNANKVESEVRKAFGNVAVLNKFNQTLRQTGRDAGVVDDILKGLSARLRTQTGRNIGLTSINKEYKNFAGTLREVDRLVDGVFAGNISTSGAVRAIRNLAANFAGTGASAEKTREALDALGDYFENKLVSQVKTANRELEKFAQDEAKRSKELQAQAVRDAAAAKKRELEQRKVLFKTQKNIQKQQNTSGILGIVGGAIKDTGVGPFAEFDQQRERQLKAQAAFQRVLAKETQNVQREQKRLNQFLERANELRKEGNIRLSRDQEKILAQAQTFATTDAKDVARKRLVGADIGVSATEVEGIANSTKKLNKEIQSFNTNTLTLEKFGQAARLAFKRYAAFVVGSSLIFGVTSNLRAATTAALELEAVFTKIQQVLKETDKGLKPLRDEIRSLSAELGVVSKDLAEGVFFFAQSGVQEIKDLTVLAQNLAKVPLSATFGDINETSEGLVAIFGQFNLTALDTGRVLDLVNQFAADFAVESKDIFEAVKRGGSAFSVAGGDLEEFIALFSVLREATRESASTLGTFFKSGFAQILQGSSQQLLKQLGVQSEDLTSQLNELSNILFGDDSQFSDRRRIEIARQLTGERQFARLLALLRQLQDDDTAARVQEAFAAAPGSLDESLASRLDDIGVSIDRIRQTFISFVSEVLENDSFKRFASDIANLTKTFFDLLSVIQPIIPFLTILAGFKLSQGFSRIIKGAFPNGLGDNISRDVRARFGSEGTLSDLRRDRIRNVVAERRRRSFISKARGSALPIAGVAGFAIGQGLANQGGTVGAVGEAISSTIALGAIGSAVGGPVGAVVGALVGLVSSTASYIKQEGQKRLTNEINLAVRSNDPSQVIAAVARQSLSQASSAFNRVAGPLGATADQEQIRNSISRDAVRAIIKNVENDGLGGREFVDNLRKVISDSRNTEEVRKALAQSFGEGFTDIDISNLLEGLKDLKFIDLEFKEFLSNFGAVNNKFIEFGNRFEVASRFVTAQLDLLDRNVANIVQGLGSIIIDPSAFVRASAGSNDQILNNIGLGTFGAFVDSSVDLFNTFIDENKDILRSFTEARLGTQYEAFEDELDSAEGFFRALGALESGGLQNLSEIQRGQISSLVSRFGEGFDKVFALAGTGFDLKQLFASLLGGTDTRQVIEGILPKEAFDRVATSVNNLINSFNLELQKRTELVQSLSNINSALNQASIDIVKNGVERSLRIITNSLSTDAVGSSLRQVSVQQSAANSLDVSDIPALLAELTRLTPARNSANLAAQSANLGGAGLNDLTVIQQAQDVNEKYITTQSLLEQASVRLSERLNFATQITDSLTQAFRTYQDQLRSAGAAVLSFGVDDLGRAFAAFDTFIGLSNAGGGLGTAGGTTNALNNITRDQFDRLQSLLQAIGSFNIGGISGTDLIGNIQEQLAVPFLARARSAVTGESNADAAKFITDQLAKLQADQAAAVAAEDQLRALQQQIVVTQSQNLTEDAKLIQDQFRVVAQLSNAAILQEKAANLIINALGSNFNGTAAAIPGVAPVNLDTLVSTLNTSVDSLTGLTTNLTSSIDKLTTNGIKTENFFTVSPVQVNVALSVPDVLRVVGPELKTQILNAISERLSEVFQDDQEKLSIIKGLGN